MLKNLFELRKTKNLIFIVGLTSPDGFDPDHSSFVLAGFWCHLAIKLPKWILPQHKEHKKRSITDVWKGHLYYPRSLDREYSICYFDGVLSVNYGKIDDFNPHKTKEFNWIVPWAESRRDEYYLIDSNKNILKDLSNLNKEEIRQVISDFPLNKFVFDAKRGQHEHFSCYATFYFTKSVWRKGS